MPHGSSLLAELLLIDDGRRRQKKSVWSATPSSSLDDFLYDPTDPSDLSGEEKLKFERWVERVLGQKEEIAAMIERALHRGMHSEWEEESLNHKFRLGSYYPSMIEHCLRQQAYSYTAPIPPSKEDLAVFREGRAIHELIALSLRRSGLISIEGSEVVVDLKFEEEGAKLHGRIDDLLLIRMTADGPANDNNFRLFIPLEIKSIGSLPSEPRQSHYYQLSTYLFARDFPLGVLLYWAKRGGGVKAFSIPRDDVMRSVLRERVSELHEALKGSTLPRKEASNNRDYVQCERCAYAERCNPFLIEPLKVGAEVALFDIENTLLDPIERRRAAMKDLGLSPSMRPMDIHDRELRDRFYELYNSPRYAGLDLLVPRGRDDVYGQVELGRAIIGISSARHDTMLEATRARLANLGVPVSHVIVRESGNYDTDVAFKTKWAIRLEANYEVREYYDRDALATSEVLKSIERQRAKKTEAKEE